jgi:hypothetical protein
VCSSDLEDEMKSLMQNKSSEQKKAIKYIFYADGGCLKKGMKDEEYESIVMAKVKSIDTKQKALNKIGLDESQVNEIVPIHLEGYLAVDSNKKKIYNRVGKDGILRTSVYQVSWVFFSSTQIYMYQYTFGIFDGDKKETTEEYFYKDITNFSTDSDTVETTDVKTNCLGKSTYKRINVDTNRFALVVPGDKFYCAMKQNDYTEKAIQGMKAKLREKKG